MAKLSVSSVQTRTFGILENLVFVSLKERLSKSENRRSWDAENFGSGIVRGVGRAGRD